VSHLRALFLTVALAGCYPPQGASDEPPPVKPQQEEAVAKVLAVYQAPADLGEPAVRWREGVELDCGNGAGWNDGVCVAGVFDLHAPAEVTVAWRPGDTYSRTGLAHELWHWLLFWRGQDPDQQHRGSGFARGGAVEQANGALASAGL
jgi:hypothetical protein